MAYLLLKSFTSQGVLGINQPQPETLACMTDFFFCSLIVMYL